MDVSSLYKQCSRFEKRATARISIQRNTEPFLQELTRLSKRSYDDAIEFCDEHCEKKLGEGSSRAAYLLDGDLLIKVSINDKGLAQCRTEDEISAQRYHCVNNALVSDSEGYWIIFSSTERITEKRFKELTGMSFKQFNNALFYKFNQESDEWSKPQDYDEIEQNALFKCVSNLVMTHDVLIGDLSKISSWGLKDGKPVLVDVGLDHATYDRWYSDNSSSTKPKSSSSS